MELKDVLLKQRIVRKFTDEPVVVFIRRKRQRKRWQKF